MPGTDDHQSGTITTSFAACLQCGRRFHSAVSTCPFCAAPRIPGDDVLTTRGDIYAGEVTAPPPSQARSSPFRSPHDLAVLARALLAAAVVFGAVVSASTIAFWRLIDTAVRTPGTVTAGDLASAADRFDRLALARLGVMTVVGLVFLVWMWRSYGNLRALGVTEPRFHAGWVIAGWIVPIWSWFRPKQIMDDIWRSGEPSESIDLGHGWARRRVTPWLHMWWALVLLGVWIGTALRNAEPDDLAGLRAVVLLVALLDVSLTAGAFLTMRLVGRATLRQALRARQVGHEAVVTDAMGSRWAAARSPVDALRASPALLVALVVLIFGIPVMYHTSGSGQPGATLVEDLRVGDCVDDPVFDTDDLVPQVLSMPVRDCMEPHDYEVFAIAVHPDGPGVPFPGQTTVAEASAMLCLGSFESYVGMAYEFSVLDIAWIAPLTREIWNAGSRSVTCLLYRLDGSKLMGPARNASI